MFGSLFLHPFSLHMQGYIPSADSKRAYPENYASATDNAETSKDAYDDRMNRYEAIGKFEDEYWKARGQAGEKWAQDQVSLI